eukprot:767531-Hanusia_phi.AAC.7
MDLSPNKQDCGDREEPSDHDSILNATENPDMGKDPGEADCCMSSEYDSLGLLIDSNGLKAFHTSAGGHMNPDDSHAPPLPACRDCNISDIPIVEILKKTERWHLKRSAFNFEGAAQGRIRHISSNLSNFTGSILLGEGSVGTVVKAKLNGNPVAVKILREDLKSSMQHLKDLIQEVLAASILENRHPNLVGFYGACLDMDDLRIVYELVDGQNLEEILNLKCSTISPKRWRPPLDLALSWAKQMLSALTCLHHGQPSIIHRDVKPSNLFLSSNLQEVKLGDFGLCKVLYDQHENLGSPRQMSGNTGSWRYMAPEVFTEQGGYIHSYTTKVDIYSAAIVIWCMCTGELPFASMDPHRIALMVRRQGLRPPLHFLRNQRVAKILHRAWSSNPSERPSAATMALKLSRVSLDDSEVAMRDDDVPMNFYGSWPPQKVWGGGAVPNRVVASRV